MNLRKREIIEVSIITAFLIILLLIKPTITGYTFFSENSININLSSLNYTDPKINLTDNEIKLNRETKIINLTNISLVSQEVTNAIHNSIDKTQQISTLENDHINLKENETLDITFNVSLNNNDIINLYLLNGSETTIYISSDYGSVNFNGTEGWYTIILLNLNNTLQTFSINAQDKVKIDYVNSTYYKIDILQQNETTYPNSAAIETHDITIDNIKNWNELQVNEDLNNENITYKYSIDLGINWFEIYNKNLTSINSTKIRIRANLTSINNQTPIIKSLSLTYILKETPSQETSSPSGGSSSGGSNTFIRGTTPTVNEETKTQETTIITKEESEPATTTQEIKEPLNEPQEESIKENMETGLSGITGRIIKNITKNKDNVIMLLSLLTIILIIFYIKIKEIKFKKRKN